MKLKLIFVIKHFDFWGIDFIGPFLNSFENLCILVAIDYISKWIETVSCKTNDNKVVIKFSKEISFQDSVYHELS